MASNNSAEQCNISLLRLIMKSTKTTWKMTKREKEKKGRKRKLIISLLPCGNLRKSRKDYQSKIDKISFSFWNTELVFYRIVIRIALRRYPTVQCSKCNKICAYEWNIKFLFKIAIFLVWSKCEIFFLFFAVPLWLW